MRKLILLLLCLEAPSYAALSATVQWDVRTTGSDSNSGGFDPAVSVPGTDYSQQNSPQITYTDLVVGATTTTYTSVLNVVSSALPGNTLVVTGGTGCTTGTYEVLSNATITATVDRSLGTAASVCTAVLGGSKASYCSSYSGSSCTAGGLSKAITGNTIWQKTGSYVQSGTQNTTNAAGSALSITIEGYGSTHGDFGTAPVWSQASPGANYLTIQTSTPAGVLTLVNIQITVGGIYTGAYLTGNELLSVYSCIFNVTGTGSALYIQNAGSSIEAGIFSSSFVLASGANGINDLSGNGGVLVAKWNAFSGGAVGISDGNNSASQKWLLIGNSFYGNTRGIYAQAGGVAWLQLDSNSFQSQTDENVYSNGSPVWVTASNNAFYGGTYGIRLVGYTFAVAQSNAYGNLSTANYSGFVAGMNSSDIALTANPFTSTSNFALNSTSGGGALLKGAGYPGATAAGTGYIDVGALQSKGSSGGTASVFVQ